MLLASGLSLLLGAAITSRALGEPTDQPDTGSILLMFDDEQHPTFPLAQVADQVRAAMPSAVVDVRQISTAAKENTLLFDSASQRYRYDHLIMVGGRMPIRWTAREVVGFVEKSEAQPSCMGGSPSPVKVRGNFLWILPDHAQVDDEMRQVAKEFGRGLDRRPAKIVDFHADSPDELPLLVAENGNVWSAQAKPFSLKVKSATAHRLDHTNPLLFPLITARHVATSQCAQNAGKDCRVSHGRESVVASALQGRNQARMVLLSGSALLTDRSAAGVFADLLAWTLQQKSTLVLRKLEVLPIHKKSSTISRYQTGDTIQIDVCLSDSAGTASIQPTDLQIELVMMQPRIRAKLWPTSYGCLSTGPFALPERMGTYKLRLGYHRRGLWYIKHEEPFPVHPLYSDQVAALRRGHIGSLPFYAAWWSMIAGAALVFVPFAIAHLSHDQAHSKQE